jgi:hypothetical protein
VDLVLELLDKEILEVEVEVGLEETLAAEVVVLVVLVETQIQTDQVDLVV